MILRFFAEQQASQSLCHVKVESVDQCSKQSRSDETILSSHPRAAHRTISEKQFREQLAIDCEYDIWIEKRGLCPWLSSAPFQSKR